MSQSNHLRVKALFQQAIQLPESEWDHFLDVNCTGDLECRVAVRRLLDHHVDDTLISDASKKREASRRTRTLMDTRANFDATVTSRRNSPSAITGIARSVTRSITKQRYRIWLIALTMVLALSLAGVYVDRSLRHLTVQNTENLLVTLLNQQVEAIDMWLDAEFRFAQTWISSEEVIAELQKIDAMVYGKQLPPSQISEAGDQLREVFRRMSGAKQQVRWAVWNREYREIAATGKDSPVLGNGATEFGGQILSRVLQGESVLWLQSTKGYITRGYVPDNIQIRPDVAIMVPVFRKDDPVPIAALLLSGFGMQDRFQEIMNTVQFAESGETYAIDKDGYLITESRFVDHLHSVGLLPPDKLFSARAIRVSEPGVNTYEESLPNEDRASWPLTLAARMVTSGNQGNNFIGYPDYRGVNVVGAWAWLDKYDFGIVTELNCDTALKAMTPLRRTYGSLLGLCALAGFAGLIRNVILERARLNASVEKEIGPYTIDRQIGEGGLAFVYLAHHSLLRRPTAIKQLKPEHLTPQNLQRFEREVQLASNLTHPNTIDIYDYGITPKGNFYCAMEFVDGITLQTMVDIDGRQPPERVAFLLIEICRSLREAHSVGLIHRDIKPHNIMVCSRADEYDCVKVLDFGLAREFDSDASRATDTLVLIGTPMYIAPERILDPSCIDHRSDIFSIGVLAHVLLVGKEPFSGVDPMSILSQTLTSQPIRPSDVTRAEIPKKLDDFVWRCQARKPEERFQSMNEMIGELSSITFELPWTQARAREWWKRKI